MEHQINVLKNCPIEDILPLIKGQMGDVYGSFAKISEETTDVYTIRTRKLAAVIVDVNFSTPDSGNWVAVIETPTTFLGNICCNSNIPLDNFVASIASALVLTENAFKGQRQGAKEILTNIKLEMLRCLPDSE
jgi:hypothetical protein